MKNIVTQNFLMLNIISKFFKIKYIKKKFWEKNNNLIFNKIS